MLNSTALPYHLLPNFLQTPRQQQVTQLHALFIKTSTLHAFSSQLVAPYAHPDINNPPYARSLLNKHRSTDDALFTYNAVIKCYLQNHRSQDALSLFHDFLSLSGVVPDEFALPCAVKACANLLAIAEGKTIHGLAIKLGLFQFPDAAGYVGSSLVSFYSKCGDIGSARKVFDKMIKKDLVTWNSLLDGYVKCGGDVDIVLRLFDEMPERDAFSWTVLIDGLSKSGRVEDAREVFDKMPTKTLASWNAMINGYMKSGDYKSARFLFDHMAVRNTITWNTMISGYDFNDNFLQALYLFRKMLNEDDIEVSVATLVSVLSAISKLASLCKGTWVHSYMVKRGHALDGILGTALIEMYSKCGSIESALVVFQEISKKKLGHWTAIIVGFGMHGMASDALKFFSAMQRNGLKPNAITFVGLLNACNHAGLIKEGRHYFNLMTNEYGIQPTIELYGCLVDILCRAGQLEEAKSIIENMPMKPNKIVWMSLLSGAKNSRNMVIGEFAAKHVMELAPETAQCYVLLSNLYALAGRWDRVSKVREIMKRKGLKKDPGYSSIEHKGVFHQFVVGDKSHPQSELIYCKLNEMKDKLKLAGHVPDTTQVLLFVKGEKEKEAELEFHSERLAIAFGLITVDPRTPIRIVKNLRICNDCHSVIKLISKVYNREIIARDNSRFHHFKSGSCSCKDYW